MAHSDFVCTTDDVCHPMRRYTQLYEDFKQLFEDRITGKTDRIDIRCRRLSSEWTPNINNLIASFCRPH